VAVCRGDQTGVFLGEASAIWAMGDHDDPLAISEDTFEDAYAKLIRYGLVAPFHVIYHRNGRAYMPEWGTPVGDLMEDNPNILAIRAVVSQAEGLAIAEEEIRKLEEREKRADFLERRQVREREEREERAEYVKKRQEKKDRKARRRQEEKDDEVGGSSSSSSDNKQPRKRARTEKSGTRTAAGGTDGWRKARQPRKSSAPRRNVLRQETAAVGAADDEPTSVQQPAEAEAAAASEGEAPIEPPAGRRGGRTRPAVRDRDMPAARPSGQLIDLPPSNSGSDRDPYELRSRGTGTMFWPSYLQRALTPDRLQRELERYYRDRQLAAEGNSQDAPRMEDDGEIPDGSGANDEQAAAGEETDSDNESTM
jgi:hypothetical protein